MHRVYAEKAHILRPRFFLPWRSIALSILTYYKHGLDMDAIPWVALLEKTNNSVEFLLISSSSDQCSSLYNGQVSSASVILALGKLFSVATATPVWGQPCIIVVGLRYLSDMSLLSTAHGLSCILLFAMGRHPFVVQKEKMRSMTNLEE